MRKAWAVAAAALAISQARADEVTRWAAKSGSWAEIEHSVTAATTPDMCVALDTASNVSFFSLFGAVAIRISDGSWALPDDFKSVVRIRVGGHNFAFNVSSNTATMVEASIHGRDARGLFSDMDKATSMDVVVGDQAPRKVSLVDGAKVTDAFRTCSWFGAKPPRSPVDAARAAGPRAE